MPEYDAVIVGAGPNGLTAAAHIAAEGGRVLVVEQADTIGGGTRTEQLTVPGCMHDVCAAVHPLGFASPAFESLGLDVQWVQPDIPAAHPLGEGRSAAAMRNLDDSLELFGPDANRYRDLIGPLVDASEAVIEDFLRPVLGLPRNPGSFARMATKGALPASRIIERFQTPEVRGLLAGMAAHAISPLTSPLTGGVMTLFAMTTHAYGWPLVAGGSQGIATALADVISSRGGVIETGHEVTSLSELPDADVFMLDVMPNAAALIAGDRIDERTRRRLSQHKPGPAVFKVDWALSGPIPWLDDLSPRAGTVHVGGTYEGIRNAERQVEDGQNPERPLVLLAQPSMFDPTRAPAGIHTVWAYCHVPNRSSVDMTDRIEAQVERFAPGFRDLILERSTMDPMDMEEHNPNYIGGDIGGGGFGMRKVLGGKIGNPYRLGDGVYLCSSATPPGAGVHGMCGFLAAKSAMKRELR